MNVQMHTALSMAVLLGVMMIFALLFAFSLISNMLLVHRGGKRWWFGIVPFVKWYMFFDIVYGRGSKAFLLLIPFYSVYVLIRFIFDEAEYYTGRCSFGVGLLLLNPVFHIVMAFKSVDASAQNSRSIEETNADALAYLKQKYGKTASDK